MRRKRLENLIVLAVLCLVGCGRSIDTGQERSDEPDAVAAVSNSYLAAVAREFLGAEVPLAVLAEPGMCPGHFDMRPSQVRQAASCRVVLRFDFQRSLDARFQAASSRPPRIVAVTVPGGMCEPASYVAACRQTADALVAEGLVPRDVADQRIADVAARMEELAGWARQQLEAAGLAGTPVLTSRHQAAFCGLLGLKVAATFPVADTALLSEVDAAAKQGREAGIRLIVANRPEGRQAADALADQFQARVVVFDNFPTGQEPDAFERLVRGNVAALVEAARP